MTIRNYLQAAVLLLILEAVVRAPAQTHSASAPAQLKYTPGMTMKTLAGHADNEELVFPSGMRITVRDMRKAQDAARVMMAQRQHQEFPSALRTRPAPTGTRIASGADIAAALRRGQPNETLQLPSGRTITTGQLQLMQSQIEARTGHSLADIKPRPTLAQANVIIKPNTPKVELRKQLTGLKDSDIIATPKGSVVTAGEVRSYFHDIPGQKAAAGKRTSAPKPIGLRTTAGGAK